MLDFRMDTFLAVCQYMDLLTKTKYGLRNYILGPYFIH